MTAEEIREYDPEHDNADYAQFSMLREIAAQLAELNAALKPLFIPPMVVHDADNPPETEWRGPSIRGPLNLRKDHR